jgi:hypothetical protein
MRLPVLLLAALLILTACDGEPDQEEQFGGAEEFGNEEEGLIEEDQGDPLE